jgi:hypothetical protein
MKSFSTTMVSNLSFFFFSRSALSLGVSRVINEMRLLSGDQRKPLAPFSSDVSFSASPPKGEMSQI